MLTLPSSAVILDDPFKVANALSDSDRQAILALAKAIADQEEEASAFMPTLRPSLTGLDNAIWYSVAYSRHRPRIKIAVDPADRISQFRGTTAVMLIETGQVIEGEDLLSAQTYKKIGQFVALIRNELLGYWNADETGVDEDVVRAAAQRARAQLGL
jgi:hypothetical protein